MVYPHGNDLGKNPPPKPKPTFWSIMDEEMAAIKAGIEKDISEQSKLFNQFLPPPWNSPVEKTALYKQLYGLPSDMVYKKPEPKPKLIEGVKYEFKFDDLTATATPMVVKTGRMRFDIKGLTDKTHGVEMQFMLPPDGMNEIELRAFLMKNFQTITEKIIEEVKKEVL